MLICADHSYSHRPDDPKASFSKSYYVHCRYEKWKKWEITKPRLAARLLLAQSQRTDLRSPNAKQIRNRRLTYPQPYVGKIAHSLNY